ncbi:HNH endonuclease [Bacillus sp. AFS031507]|uniref:HNH endonuclease n=1 Tax=Bacillus sp. AFS031507 TaxID=2033496 RepID=UPI000BFC4B7F|nr:HNH endonuclease [Bacillus sp. AFS031507]PGY13190.1 HNH endonuclease [Bacillus sp. AFS031507]
MLKSCSWCGSVVDRSHLCPNKPEHKKTFSGNDQEEIYKFRKKQVWVKKRKYILERDRGLCQICFRNLHNTQKQYTPANEVHHIVKMIHNRNRWLDETNLLLVCSYHHTLADHGHISIDDQHKIAEDQEKAFDYYGH